ncbi:DUF92 domain-containing protein [Peribacillus alkalitolerans]|uniref:DUF92 domain-containing protein n=1 Tax=Peribacillus alkalitolerans TaxID=1550385 RepID=UPI001F07FD31|nr:DUF92 domain-containing protein [Peribacillus alkalitolerans]
MNIEYVLYFLVILITAISGYFVKSLSFSGAIATFFVGCLTAVGFQWQGLFILGFFFASSSLWSKFKQQQKKHVENKLEKSDRRDYVQVFANGGLAASSGLIYYLTGDSIWLITFLVSIAAANSDTWASEVGVLSKGTPIHILTWKKVDKGTSGAISTLGTTFSLLGAAFIGIIAAYLWDLSTYQVLLIIFFGFLGSAVDTVLGATVQEVHQCNNCSLETEKRIHCGMPTRLKKGLKYIDNDKVNFLSITIVVLLSILFI